MRPIQLDLDRAENPKDGTATVTCDKEAYETCETLLSADVTGGEDDAVPGVVFATGDELAGSHLEPKVHPFDTFAVPPAQTDRVVGDPFPRPISAAFKAAITELIVTDKAFSDQNFEAKLREYFVKLQRQARSELEPRKLQVDADGKRAGNGFPVADRGGLADAEWTEHCTRIDQALESPEWDVGDGAVIYKAGKFKFQDLLEVERGVPTREGTFTFESAPRGGKNGVPDGNLRVSSAGNNRADCAVG